VNSGRSAATVLAAHAPRTAMAVCACLLVAEACSVAWHVVHARASAGALPAQLAHIRPGAQAGRDGAERIAAIIGANLFGVAPAADPPQVADGSLQLVGLLAYHDPASGIAMLRAASGEVAVVRAGTVTSGGVLLREVYADHVVMERGGSAVSLMLVQPLLRVADAGLLPAPATAAADSAIATRPEPGQSLVSYFTPPGVPPGLTFASRLAMEQERKAGH
jgi:type II secretory pathway component PulC